MHTQQCSSFIVVAGNADLAALPGNAGPLAVWRLVYRSVYAADEIVSDRLRGPVLSDAQKYV